MREVPLKAKFFRFFFEGSNDNGWQFSCDPNAPDAA